MVGTGLYKLLIFLRYEEVCGAEDRDDTMLVVRIEDAQALRSKDSLNISQHRERESEFVVPV